MVALRSLAVWLQRLLQLSLARAAPLFKRRQVTSSHLLLLLLCVLIIILSFRQTFHEPPPTPKAVVQDPPPTRLVYKVSPAGLNAFQRAQKYWGVESPPQQSAMYTLLAQFDMIARYHNISYLLHQSTALGAYRHHGLMPWDHQLVILIEWMNPQTLQDFFFGTQLMLERRTTDLVHRNDFWVIYHNSYVPEKHLKDTVDHLLAWPYLEIHRYQIENGVLVDVDSPQFRHPVGQILPPVFAHFGTHMLPTYRCLDKVIPKLFTVDHCCLPDSFVNELTRPTADGQILEHSKVYDEDLITCMACQALKKHFPFVHQRVRLSPFLVHEELRLAEGVIAARTVYRPECGLPVMGRI